MQATPYVGSYHQIKIMICSNYSYDYVVIGMVMGVKIRPCSYVATICSYA